MILNPVFAIGLASGISLSIAFQQLLALQPPTSRNSHRRRTTSATPTKLSISNASLLTNSRGELDSGFESADSSMAGMCSGDVFESLSRELGLSTHSLTLISAAMTKALKKGLLCDGQGLPMIPSHVVGLPKGSETGAVLALDLGGSNFRVCMVTLDGHGSARTIQRKFVLSDAVKTQTGTVLFDFLAKCIAEFMDENKKVLEIHSQDETTTESKVYNLGFTFSFPVKQTAVNEGSLMYWNKGFTSNGVVGRDVVGLLQESLNRLGIKVRVTALVNDTVGTLVAHAYSRPQTRLGVIFGTGTNAAYVEKLSEIGKWNGPASQTGEMIVNTEWGAFNSPCLPVSKYDRMVDAHTNNPKTQVFEKMISGLYLGEIARYVLVDLIEDGELFAGVLSKQLSTPYAFETSFMSRIERDHSLELLDVKQLLADLLSVRNTTLKDRQLIKHVCELVGTRAARLSAAGIASIVIKANLLSGCIVAIDGSLFGQYPHFGSRMRDALREILGVNGDNIILEKTHDGSGLGAALIAALH
ncbi:hypothetical protein BASA50_003838 [Batrachochytrium salamandrivorans]|uniref:Phosphotransferase n=1 Tax=Batrachochytrium salamandrivorans TaxID=1357716 RepID=A0ABQ8FH67_9FUNG|nr:hypothetical protein BASA62_010010 [Batrachochytrium salamandrivorans]KAH6579036.1 hypothetical protein BASA60_003431 [Batrachochytrium salamandrivorans]KAH6595680.1 hypothetical protein BASA61_003714 [Batrachochytrium salamandrivorans]KAH6598223.1 hypothetical protein BASA50_003838 [Batrachochytrium salamandrivorans]KAH9251447.1 hypothetical protein BASA81_010683 [Batrachochytrium salamandrivorans]